jgi:hypothetical protein
MRDQAQAKVAGTDNGPTVAGMAVHISQKEPRMTGDFDDSADLLWILYRKNNDEV